MPAVDPKAVLEIDDIRRAMAYAERDSPFAAALFAWMYEFGARAAEPGLQLVKDVDVRSSRARAVHLKDKGAFTGIVTRSDWHALLPFCRRALPVWLDAREAFIKKPQQRTALFPSAIMGHCYTCFGTGKRPILRRRKGTNERYRDGTTKCHHCAGTGERWGVAHQEVYATISKVLRESGAPAGRQHPHVLRHSIITHLLEGGTAATVVQDRVGHKLLSTTLAYARATKAAAAQMERSLAGVYAGDPDDEP